MDLKNEIVKIVNLQRIDSQIYNLRKEKDEEIPAKLERLGAGFEEKKKLLADFESRVTALQLKRKDKELELASQEEGVKKAQAHLYQLKTNREYQAKLTEISSLKADVSILEEEVIKILEAIEEAGKNLKEEKDKVSREEKKFKDEEMRLKARIEEIEIEMKGWEDKRSILIKDIDKNILSKYERLLSIRSGLAIASVENDNCGACYMRVTAQTINEIKMYKELVFCENCLRILYITDDIGQ